MKLLFIYGRPAVGKLTVAREVAKLTGGRLFHNHLTVNLVLALHEFGSPAFIELREKLWLAAFRSAVAAKVPLLIFTFNPENSVPQRFIDELFSELAEAGAEVIPVELTASEMAIEERIGSASRLKEGKTLDVGTYRALRERGVFETPKIAAPQLTIDTEANSLAQSALRITALLGGH
jgi:hypothetical protein